MESGYAEAPPRPDAVAVPYTHEQLTQDIRRNVVIAIRTDNIYIGVRGDEDSKDPDAPESGGQ